ncbi:MAG TPA: 30S ribosomal protein S2 [Patescibacteria group bacterium]|jgi:small subunit ribosomal protein S2|nr:30S ribosomal protein S2 [Patescibacteria group bacterium]
MINFRELVKKGVHFGHQTSRWCPKMSPYIWGIHNKTHLFDVSKTALLAEKAKVYLEQLSSEGKTFLWVGTKKAAQESIQTLAKEFNMPYVIQRWVGGTLSNFSQVKKSVTKLLHLEDVLAKNSKNSTHYTKKELINLQKVIMRLEKSVGGLRKLSWPVAAIIVVDVTKELAAIREARKMGIPVIGLVDTNGDPSLVDFVIPGNDDATQSIHIILEYLAEGIRSGRLKAIKSTSSASDVTTEINDQESGDIATTVLTLSSDEDEPTQANKKKGFNKKTLGSNIKSIPGAPKRTLKNDED